jgi:UDP-N-acetylmuramate: L-alanyl-gamma-D-glutamyl-meso-diaminopimelate ligase
LLLQPGSRVHVLGACGTAMATLCAMLQERGHHVRGSDQDVYPPMSDMLRERGIELLSPYSVSNLEPPPDLVVVGNAIPRGNPELEEVLDRGWRYRSAPEVLRDEFLEGRHPVVITGTHGKTTITTMTTVALMAGGLDPSCLVGGYSNDLGGSFRLGQGAEFVLEGDEYDTAYFDKTAKFLKYFPRTLVVNNVEFDHADIYESLDAIKLMFRRLVRQVPRSGVILVGDSSPHGLDVVRDAPAPVERFGLDAGSTWRASAVEVDGDGMRFTVSRRGEELGSLRIPFSGEYNVRNALAAVAVAVTRGAAFADAARGLSSMTGIKRRLERRGEAMDVLVYDDFAHHPTAIRETLRAVKARHPGRRVWGIFEPRSWTCRRNVHQAALGEALAEADAVVLTPVYQPEKVADDVRLDPGAVVAAIRAAGRKATLEDDAPAVAVRVGNEAEAGDVVVVMSNGGFGGVHELILDRLSKRETGA